MKQFQLMTVKDTVAFNWGRLKGILGPFIRPFVLWSVIPTAAIQALDLLFIYLVGDIAYGFEHRSRHYVFLRIALVVAAKGLSVLISA
ncbi:MAG TPA: hypothetical protein VFT82_02540, partial [Candidatus Paceibacterota bacterium]|nr:hypothetical protein [Candidatus Paceibacterota bacterium]